MPQWCLHGFRVMAAIDEEGVHLYPLWLWIADNKYRADGWRPTGVSQRSHYRGPYLGSIGEVHCVGIHWVVVVFATLPYLTSSCSQVCIVPCVAAMHVVCRLNINIKVVIQTLVCRVRWGADSVPTTPPRSFRLGDSVQVMMA